MKKNGEYCSQCKCSKYVMLKGEKRLKCVHAREIGGLMFQPTDSKLAEECCFFESENWREALTTHQDYVNKMKRCGIPLFFEKLGVLSKVKLRPS